ncbi:MAG: hypothetical protein ABL925_07265 [Methylococcales bacterium]
MRGQKKVSKEKAALCRWILRAACLAGGYRKGLLPLRHLAASLPPPFGLIPAKQSVLGAAEGIFRLRRYVAAQFLLSNQLLLITL